MTDLDDRLRQDAARWNAAAVPKLDLDELLRQAIDRRTFRPRRYIAPLLSAAAVIALVIALAVTGVFNHRNATPASTNDLSQITGVVWTDQASNATIVFDTRTARIFDGCSNGLRVLTVSRDRLSIGKPLGKQGVCTGTPQVPGSTPDPREIALTRFYAVIARPATWQREGNELILTTPTNGRLVLTTDGSPAPELTETHWQLTEYAGRGFNSTAYTGSLGDLYVASDGRAEAGDGCVSVSGHAAITDTTVTFTFVGHSTLQCSPLQLRIGAIVESVLPNASYGIRGNQLILSNKYGELVYNVASS